MGVGFVPQGGLSGWAPGQVPRHLPDGAGFFLPKGSRRGHAGPLPPQRPRREGPHADRPVLRQEAGRQAVPRRRRRRRLGHRPVPPVLLDPRRRRSASSSTAMPGRPRTAPCYSVMPHMHMLGKEIKVTMTPPDGEAQTLIAIKDWDYNWQETYFLKEPIAGEGGHAVSTSRRSTTTAPRTRTTRSTRRGASPSASRRPTRCASCSSAERPARPTRDGAACRCRRWRPRR